jgi:Fic family protein
LSSWDVHFDLTIKHDNRELIRLTERAYALSSMIREVPIPPYLQAKLDAINVMRAVRGTTAIEGVQASTEEVQKIMASPKEMSLPKSRERDEQEIKNAATVMTFVAYIIGKTPDLAVSQQLICAIHKLMTRKIDDPDNAPGQYRSHPVNAGDYYPPASGEEVRRLMNDFVEWLNSPPALNWDAITRALAAHFYLVSIHPFGDGNGRTSRAIESFLLYQGKVNARGFYSLANYYYHHRSDYVWHLNHARFNSGNDLTDFVLFGLRGLVEELEDVYGQVLNEIKLISFRDYAREEFQLTDGLGLGTKVGERLFHFLIALGREPMPMSQLTNRKSRAKTIYGNASLRTVQRDIAFLKERELIKIEDGAIMPNLDVMKPFTAPYELQRFLEEEPENA